MENKFMRKRARLNPRITQVGKNRKSAQANEVEDRKQQRTEEDGREIVTLTPTQAA
jgi:hypothetical protein